MNCRPVIGTGFALGLLLSFAALGQTGIEVRHFYAKGIQAEAAVGFRNEAFGHLPTPVVLRLGNDSGKDLTPRLEIRFSVAGNYQDVGKTQSFELDLPNRSRKKYNFCLSLENGAYDSLEFRLLDGRRLLWAQPVSVVFTALSSVNVLVVDSQRNRIPLPPLPTGINLKENEADAARMLAVTEYELPSDDAPLAAFHAVVFTPNIDQRQLSRRQCGALARYAAKGGTVMLFDGHSQILQRVRRQAPFPFERPSRTEGGLRIQGAGAGQLVSYRGRPNAVGDSAGRLQAEMLDCILQAPGSGFLEHVQRSPYQTRTSSAAAVKSILMVVVLFLLYTTASGPVMIGLRKAKRRTRMIYVAALVGVFSVLVIVLGLLLSRMKGPAKWISVTELTPDGTITQAMVEVNSVGGRRHELVFKNKATEAWLVEATPVRQHYYAWNVQAGVDNPPRRDFPMLNELLTEPSPSHEMQVPVTPWGSRSVIARQFNAPSGMLQIECRILRKADSGTQPTMLSNSSANTFLYLPADVILEITNTTAHPLSSCRFILSAITSVTSRWGNQNSWAAMMYQQIDVPVLQPGQTRTIRTALRLNKTMHDVNKQLFDLRAESGVVGNACLRLPHNSRPDVFHGVLFARSPVIPEIQIGDCGFLPTTGEHFVMQRVPPAKMPSTKGITVDTETALTILNKIPSR